MGTKNKTPILKLSQYNAVEGESILNNITDDNLKIETGIKEAQDKAEEAEEKAQQAIESTSYTLPTATTDRLGGVKIGNNITVTEDGTISADSYTLPVATADTLGGVKIGEHITVTDDGTISAEAGVPQSVLDDIEALKKYLPTLPPSDITSITGIPSEVSIGNSQTLIYPVEFTASGNSNVSFSDNAGIVAKLNKANKQLSIYAGTTAPLGDHIVNITNASQEILGSITVHVKAYKKYITELEPSIGSIGTAVTGQHGSYIFGLTNNPGAANPSEYDLTYYMIGYIPKYSERTDGGDYIEGTEPIISSISGTDVINMTYVRGTSSETLGVNAPSNFSTDGYYAKGKAGSNYAGRHDMTFMAMNSTGTIVFTHDINFTAT